ncbi:MAG: hypothetical protein KME64_24310 [Scytonematopsis contorta HA4267-MV1]|nr:hypothetical protein [Scytonematopsis contorta HA4267-MV1]
MAQGCWNSVFSLAVATASTLGKAADNVVILLCGGDKDSQDKDIEKAKEYWQAYQEEQYEQET